MKKTILFALMFTFLSVNAVSDEVYFLDGTNDIDNLGESSWMFIEDSAFISEDKLDINQSKTVKVPTPIEKPTAAKLFEYKDSSSSECKSTVKKRCKSSR